MPTDLEQRVAEAFPCTCESFEGQMGPYLAKMKREADGHWSGCHAHRYRPAVLALLREQRERIAVDLERDARELSQYAKHFTIPEARAVMDKTLKIAADIRTGKLGGDGDG